jgi:rhizosphere induced protein
MRRGLLLVLALALAAFSFGCGDDDGGDASATGPSAAAPDQPFEASNQAPGGTFSVTVRNNSRDRLDFAIYQTNNELHSRIEPVAWLVRSADPTTTVKFNWSPKWAFVWSETGTLVPGVLFIADQTLAADPSDTNTNSVVLDYRQDRFSFSNQGSLRAPAGSLSVQTTGGIPLRQATLGVALDGQAVYATQAAPNMVLRFPPEGNQYHLAAGEFANGEVLDLSALTSLTTQLKFPPGQTSLSVVLDADKNFVIQSG